MTLEPMPYDWSIWSVKELRIWLREHGIQPMYMDEMKKYELHEYVKKHILKGKPC